MHFRYCAHVFGFCLFKVNICCFCCVEQGQSCSDYLSVTQNHTLYSKVSGLNIETDYLKNNENSTFKQNNWRTFFTSYKEHVISISMLILYHIKPLKLTIKRYFINQILVSLDNYESVVYFTLLSKKLVAKRSCHLCRALHLSITGY